MGRHDPVDAVGVGPAPPLFDGLVSAHAARDHANAEPRQQQLSRQPSVLRTFARRTRCFPRLGIAALALDERLRLA
jgi:hypothetical protein